MKLSDLIFNIRTSIPKASKIEILMLVNKFINSHPLNNSSIVKTIVPESPLNAPEITPGSGTYSVSVDIVITDTNGILPDYQKRYVPFYETIRFIEELYVNNEKIKCGLTRDEYISGVYDDEKKYNVFGDQICFNFLIHHFDIVKIYGQIIPEKLSLASADDTEIGYPYLWTPTLENYIMKELYLTATHRDIDLFKYHHELYREHLKILRQTPETLLIKRIGTW